MYAREGELAARVTAALNGNAAIAEPPKQETATKPFSPYLIEVTATVLNIRKGPGTNYAITGTIKNKGVYTIVEAKNGWGKLKSGVGWICLKYTKKK